MKTVGVFEDYRIGVNERCFILYTRKVVQAGKHKGEERWEHVGEYNPYRMDHLLQRILHLETAKHGETFAIGEYINLWARLGEKLKTEINKKLVPVIEQ